MKGRIILKKIILLMLCFIFILSGCKSLPKAEPFYNETREDVTFSTQYEYYFDDEASIRCYWKNESTESLSFYDTFELHVLGSNGEWYMVGMPAVFNTNYCHGIDPESESAAMYNISLFTNKLDEGKTYRVSTFCFDDNGNNFQFFAEFVCDNALAEEEMEEASGGMVDRRDPVLPEIEVGIASGNK